MVAAPSFRVSAAAWLRRILIAAPSCDRDVAFCWRSEVLYFYIPGSDAEMHLIIRVVQIHYDTR